jgi:hypothetical protein
VITKNKTEFDKLFTDFSNAVKEKKYAKMPYQTWNKIKNSLCALGEYGFVEIKNDADGIRVQFHDKVYVNDFRFSWDDCSFGNFLYDKFFTNRAVKTAIGIKDTLEEKPYTWKADYMQASPVDSGEWWSAVDKPLKLTYVDGNLCLKASEDERVIINPSSIDNWKDIVIAGDCAQPKACSVDIPDYATVESVSSAIATKADKAEINNIYAVIDEIKQTAGVGLFDNKKGKNDMKNVFNFDFGPVESESIRMSMYGIAVKDASGTFVSYDINNDNIMDVDVFNFDGRKFLFKMPVAVKDVKAGDVVIHARKPMFVVSVETKSLKVVDPINGEKKEIMLTRSPFGFDFATKVVNLFDNIGRNAAPASADNPFGNMWMFMLLGKEDEAIDSNLLPFMLMNNGSMNMNPMMMYMLMNKDKSSASLLPIMMMMNNNNTNSAAN